MEAGEAKDDAIDDVVGNLARKDPAAAAELLKQQSEEAQRDGMRELMPTWTSQNPVAALAYANSFPQGRVRDSALQAYVWSNNYYRHFLTNQGNRTVFHFGSRIPLSVEVGYLLQLERPLESDWIIDAPTQKEEVGGLPEPLRELLDGGLEPQRLLEQERDAGQRLEPSPPLLTVQHPLPPPDEEGKKSEGCELGCERLGRGHSDLRPGVGQQSSQCLAAEKRARDVADAHHVGSHTAQHAGNP